MSEFHCDACNVACAFKSDYDRHMSSQRHMKREKQKEKNLADTQCECGKRYKFASSLSFHRKTCPKAQAQPQGNRMQLIVHEPTTTATTPATAPASELTEFKDMVMTMLQDNRNACATYCAVVDNMSAIIKDMIPRLGNGNVVTSTSNSTNNTQFNLNMFLNEDCKDAIKLSDFVKTLNITLNDLEYTKTKGIVEGVGSIIANNLRGMDIHKRPIHCTDAKRETMYVKTDEWIKDEGHAHLRHFIYLTSCYQTRVIQDWMNAHPGWEVKDAMHTEYQNICKELYKNIEHDDSAHKKIIKTFIKDMVQLDKQSLI
jgi:Zinc-finger of C2H2 type